MNLTFIILFLTLTNINIYFTYKNLLYRLYIIDKTLLIINYIQLISRNKFVIIVINASKFFFIVYISTYKINNIYSYCKI